MKRLIDNELRLAIESAQPFKEALSVLDQTLCFTDQLSLADQINVVTNALTQGIFDDSLSNRLNEILGPFEEYRKIIEELHINPSVYENITKSVLPITERWELNDIATVVRNMATGISSVAEVAGLAAKATWLYDDNIWSVAKSVLSTIKFPDLPTDWFSKLLRLEHETSLLDSPALNMITSATQQIASIEEALGTNEYIMPLLSDFAKYAANQHVAIHKAAEDQAEIEWRLGALDAVSRFLDRQVKWSEAITDAVQAVSNTGEEEPDEEIFSSPIALIGSHIGYSRRKNVELTPEEALEKSTIVSITEKGKKISENIVVLNQFSEDRGEDYIIKYTNKTAKALITMSTVVCSTQEQMGRVIDVLYFTFYENLERIKSFIGGGDKNIGDKMIRDEDIYQCIFNIKTIRNDIRHDLSHGSDKEIKKKNLNVGDCYRHYCNRRPVQARDYKMLQQNIYDEILELQRVLIKKAVEFSR